MTNLLSAYLNDHAEQVRWCRYQPIFTADVTATCTLRLMRYLIRNMPETRKITQELDTACVTSIFTIADDKILQYLDALSPSMTFEIFPELVEGKINQTPYTFYELGDLTDLSMKQVRDDIKNVIFKSTVETGDMSRSVSEPLCSSCPSSPGPRRRFSSTACSRTLT
jgi:hypothetical protein